ncbi:Signal transduction histidine kinase [Lutimaribacter pacificus]|uniref:histidine kinase n=1 Tax=Lutimaribacter pacificus TaxID=391948 RepID=A0A1H0BHA8_9RHOB|nr:HAMP domain-containing sensor histidine kinase [Lutimaribacter pacificus]SDN45019.1 Signal transduction histidine kinase [Lutimaribacter pacificus]SHJ56111.1 Signal transduction histidine kinase [Lutimaribacter pacificus]
MHAERIAKDASGHDPAAHDDFKRRLNDYACIGRKLFWQRFTSYSAIALLASIFYDWKITMLCYLLIWLSEFYDQRVFTIALKTETFDRRALSSVRRNLFLSTIISACVISFFCITIAVLQGPTSHFMPIFVLIAAAIFACMNNYQFVPILFLRLAIYLVSIIVIAARDIVLADQVSSEMWIQLFTTIFVLSFIIECARHFLSFYNEKINQLKVLEREHEKAKSAARAKSEFLSIVSHELRTPLTSIKGSLDLIVGGIAGPVPESFRKILEVAHRNSARLTLLIQDLLDLQKMGDGKMSFAFADLRLDQVVSEAVDEMQAVAERRSIGIRFADVDEDVIISADKNRLKQVVTNILSNAVKFSDPNQTVTVSVHRNGSRGCFSIRDEGIGIPDEEKDKVFSAFQQLDSSDHRKAEGLGLGMHIAARIVEAHGGRIGFDSKLGKGTTFFVELDEVTGRHSAPAGNAMRPAA